MVDNPYTLTWDELIAMPMEEHEITLSCVSNPVGGPLVGNAKWLGVPIVTLMERAGIQPGADQFVGKSIDDWTAGFPTARLYDGRTALLAIGMNGEPLPISHGFPARLIVAGIYGYVSAVKWVTEIELTRWEDFDGYWNVMNCKYYTGVDQRLPVPVVLPPYVDLVDMEEVKVLIADDVADTGQTLKLVYDFCEERVAEVRAPVLYEKSHSLVKCDYVWKRTDQWINFPWSTEKPVVSPEDTRHRVLDA